MSKITPFLWFNNNLEEAIEFYESVFSNSKRISINRMGEGGPIMSATFELEGQTFMALNGGPHYTFTPAISLFVSVETQEEVDELWEKLTAGGGKPEKCGWLKDKFGLSWQIIPTALGELMYDKDPVKAKNIMDAMLKMDKIDILALKRAYEQ